MFNDVYKGGEESSLSSTKGSSMTIGFSSCRLTESVGWDEDSGYNTLESYLLKSSFLTSSNKGT
jgi:hypothetical protein